MKYNVHLTDGANFVVVDFAIQNSGWVSFKRDGKKFLVPSNQIAIVETDYVSPKD